MTRAAALLLASAAVTVAATTGFGQGVDWKMYGGASMSGPEICFYDARGVARTPDRLVRVWTKCLPREDLEKVDIKSEYEGKILERAAQKVAHGYEPPAAHQLADYVDAISITMLEETANIAAIQSHAQIFYEFNCAQRMSRELSIHISAGNQQGSREMPSVWRHVPPEGNAATLLKLLCPMQ